MDSESSPAQHALLVGLLVMPVIVVIAVVLGVAGGVIWLVSAAAPTTATTTPSTTVQSALSVVNRLVVVNNQGQLETMTPEGRQQRILTDDSYVFQFPAWSPDGRSIAAIGAGRADGGVFVMADVAASSTPLYRSQRDLPIYLYWSPDSRHVSFIASDPVAGLALYLADREGSQAGQVVTTGQPFYWDWSRDGAQLLVHTGFVNSQPRLSLWDLAEAGSVSEWAAPGYFQAPDISASGRYLAYTEVTSDDRRQVVIVDRDEGRRITAPHRGLAALGWSPTDDQLLFMAGVGSAETTFGPLQLIDPLSGQTRLLTGAVALAFFWSPDGQTIAYLSPHGQRPPSRDLLAQPLVRTQPAAWQPTQRSELVFDLWFIDVASGQESLSGTFQPTRLFVSQFLPYFDQYAHSHAVWAPDSRSLVLPTFADNNSVIYRFFGDGRPPQAVAPGSMAFWSRQ